MRSGRTTFTTFHCAQDVRKFFANEYVLAKTEVKLHEASHHNPRVGGSNPSTATSKNPLMSVFTASTGFFYTRSEIQNPDPKPLI